ncbi:MAG: sugar phosphate nucleotidyltransferase [Tagaea sp.]
MEQPLADLDVAVLAGGLGTRLAGALPSLPKALAPVAGRPFVEHLLDWLAGWGARRAVFLLGHRADAVRAHLAAHQRRGLAVESVVEPSPLGTGGALAHGRAALRSDPVLVVNGDTFVDADLAALRAAHDRARADATMLCVRVPDAGRYGRLEIAGSFVARFVEKDPAFRGTAPINAGVYLLSARLLDAIPRARPVSLEREIFEKLPSGSIAAHVDEAARFVDIGTPESWRGAAAVVEGSKP